MPLPNVVSGRVAQCRAKCRQSGERCKNLSAYSMPVCHKHGAHKKIARLYGKDNPNFKHGEETNIAVEQRRANSLMFLRLEAIGEHVGLFAEGSTKLRGRKPNGFQQLDLNAPDQLEQALIESMHPKTIPKP
jgi:hypothetical protein